MPPRMRADRIALLTMTAMLGATALVVAEEPQKAPNPEAAPALRTKISLEIEKKRLRDALEQIRKASGISFAVADDILDTTQTVTVRVTEKPAIEVVEALAVTLGLVMHVTEGGVVTLAWPPQATEADDGGNDEVEMFREAGGPARATQVVHTSNGSTAVHGTKSGSSTDDD